MATVRKSLRVEEGLAERVAAAKRENENETSAYCRILEAGLDALDGHKDGADQNEADRVEDLRATIEILKEQLKTKDAQLLQAQTIADQAQKLQARTVQALPEPRKSLPKRIRAFFKGDTEQ